MRKRILAAVLCCLLLWGAFPAICQGNQAKTQFVANLQLLSQQTPVFPVDQPVTANCNLELSMLPELLNFKGNLFMQADPNQKQAMLKFEGAIQEQDGTQNMAGTIYLNQNRLIIPRATAQALMLDTPDGPEYVYLENEVDVWSNPYQNSYSPAQTLAMNQAATDLLLALLQPIPDRCFGTAGSSSTMKLDKMALLSLINAFQDPDYVATLAEPLAILFSQPGDVVSELLSSLLADELELSALNNIVINEFSITVGPAKIRSSYDLGFNTTDMCLSFTGNDQTDYRPNLVTKIQNISLLLQEPGSDNQLQLSMQAQGRGTPDSIQGRIAIALKGAIDAEEMQVQMTVDGIMKTAPAVQVVMPVLTASNSLNIGEYGLDNTIMVNYNGDFYHFSGAYLAEGRLMVSVFDLSRIFGLQQDQDRIDAVALSQGGKEIKIIAGSDICSIDGVSYSMGNAAVLKDFEIYVPLRFIMEQFGYLVSYDEASGIVNVE
ncbi:MAG: copper amine oxidase N-terminal domain-containing protein [Syntrophomonadaceae bacterium]